MKLLKILTTSLFSMLLFAAPAMAQSTYCATAQSSTGTAQVGVPITFHVCHNELDTNTVPQPVVITGWALYTNGVRTVVAFTRDPIGDSQGRHEYQRAATAPAAAGTYTYTLAAIDSVGEGTLSPTFTLTVTVPGQVPGAPTNLRTTTP